MSTSSRVCGFGREPEADQAGVYGVYAAAGEEEDGEEKQRFDRGGRFSAAAVGPEKKEAALRGSCWQFLLLRPTLPAEMPLRRDSSCDGGGTPASAAATAKAVASAKTTTNGKPKKIKREKVRFGQAPRNSLPAGRGGDGSGRMWGLGVRRLR